MSGMKVCLSVCFFILFVVAAGLVGGSFQIIEPLEYGLLQNTIGKDIKTDRVYSSGRYFTGLARTFIRYPRNRINVYFGNGGDSAPLTPKLAASSVTLECSVQYSLNPEKLIDLYKDFGTSYTTRINALASNTITNTLIASFNVSDLYENRLLVQSTISTALAAKFAEYHSIFHDFQLRAVALPDTTERTIVNKLVLELASRTALNVQQQQNINANITVIRGQYDQEIALNNARQNQIATVLQQTSVSRARQLQIDASAGAYASLQQILGLSNEELVRYLYLKQVRTLPSRATLAVGFNDVLGLVNSL